MKKLPINRLKVAFSKKVKELNHKLQDRKLDLYKSEELIPKKPKVDESRNYVDE